MTESVLLSVAGGIAGVGVATVALAVLGPMIPSGVLPGYVEPRLSGRAFGFSLSILAFVGVATGLVPAWSSARLDIASRLREGARSATGGGPGRVRTQDVFVVAQVALALVLMVGAGLLTRSFRAQLAVDTGAEVERVAALRTQLPGGRFDTGEAIRAFATELEQAVESIPGVESAALASDLPFRGGSSASYIFRQGDGPEERIRYHRHFVTPGYFETLGLRIVDGRPLDANDTEGAPGVIVITESMAARVYPGERAVGKIMTLRPGGGEDDQAEIVGVVADVRYRDVTTSLMADANSPDVFFSYWQLATRGIEVAVRTTGDPATVLPAMREALAELDADLPAYQLAPLRDAWLTQTATPRFAAFLMSLFSALAGILACVGIYGVLAFSVGQRAREIAVRRAIGASGARVARGIVRDGLRLAALGLVVGGVAAAWGVRILEGFLFGVEANDPITFGAVSLGMVALTLSAALVPALRALSRDPAEALHAD
jgi:predicted permease